MSKLTELLQALLVKVGGYAALGAADDLLPCPLHVMDRTLTVTQALPGLAIARCRHPHCQFTGTVPELIAATTKQPLPAVTACFEQGQDYYSPKLFNPALRTTHPEALDYRAAGLAFGRRFADAKQRLHNQVAEIAFSLARLGLTQDVLLELGLGLLLKEDMPEKLAKLLPAGRDLLCFPYYYNGVITHILLHDCQDDSSLQICLQDLPGVFMEPHLHWPTPGAIIVCQSALDTAVVYSKLRYTGAVSVVTPVYLSKPEALANVNSLHEICLLSAPHHRVTAMEALQLWRQHSTRRIVVMDLTRSLTAITGFELEQQRQSAVDFWAWYAENIRRVPPTADELRDLCLTAEERKHILLRLNANGVPTGIIDLFNKHTAENVERVIDGMRLVRTVEGFTELAPTCQRLTDFILQPEAYRDTQDGKIMEATLHTNIPGENPLKVSVPLRVLGTNTYTLANYLWEATLGRTACEFKVNNPSSRIDWLTILRTFSKAPYLRSATRLGFSNGILQYPTFAVDVHSLELTPHHGAVSIDPYAIDLAGGIQVGNGSLTTYSHLLQSSNLSELTLIGILGHIVHELTMLCSLDSSYRPTHLLLPSAGGNVSTGYDTFLLLVQEYTRMAEPPLLPMERNMSRFFAKQLQQMHELPVLCEIRKDSLDYEQRLTETRGSLIALTSQEVASKLSRRSDCNFMPETVPAGVTTLHTMNRDAVHVAVRLLPSLMQAILQHRATAPTVQNVASALNGVNRIASMLSTPVSPLLPQLFHTTQVDSVINTPVSFLLELYKLVRATPLSNLTYTAVVTQGAPLYYNFQRNLIAVMRERCVNLVNASGDFGFSIKRLEQQLEESQFMARLSTEDRKGYSARGIWPIRMDVWDMVIRWSGGVLPTKDAIRAVNQ